MNGGQSVHAASCVPLHSRRIERFKAAGLYFVTSQVLSRRPTLDVVQSVLDAGVTLIQLREKDLSVREFVALATAVRDRTSRYDALLIVNDRLDVALTCGADGVHLGQDDLPIAAARKLAPELIIGASSHNIDEAIAAENSGASYVNIGPVFPTKTKVWTREFLGVEGVSSIASKVHIPFTVMGGIKVEHIAALVGTGASAIALVTAVTQAPDEAAAASALLAAIRLARQEIGR